MDPQNTEDFNKEKVTDQKGNPQNNQFFILNQEAEETLDNYIQLEINKNTNFINKNKFSNREKEYKKEDRFSIKKHDNQEKYDKHDAYFHTDSDHSNEPNSDHSVEDFLDKIIHLKKNIDNSNNHTDNSRERENVRKSLIHSIARFSNIGKEYSEDELDKTIEGLHLKPENELTDKERELQVLEQIGLNCIYSRESFKLNKLDEKHAKYKEFFNKIIIGNLNWVEVKKKQDKNFFTSLIKPQKPKYLVISCADSRVVVNEFTATEPGDVFTHRNIGNLVISTDFNCQSVLQYAVEYLKVEHILLIGHTDCGAVRAALSYEHHGLIDHWLKNIREVAEKHEKDLEKCEKFGHENIVRKLIELNIREQCLNLCKSPIVQKAWDSGNDLYIHGYLFEMETGLLKDLEVVQNDWSNIQEIYKYNFRK